jgi:hypothetical protein
MDILGEIIAGIFGIIAVFIAYKLNSRNKDARTETPGSSSASAPSHPTSEPSIPLPKIDHSRVNTGGRFNAIEAFPTYKIGKLLFVYGSLLDVDSLRATIMRSSHRIDCIPILLKGYCRRWGNPSNKADYVSPDWNYCEKQLEWLSLLIQETNAPDDVVPGVIINVDTDAELRELCSRESNYQLRILPQACLFRPNGDLYAPSCDIHVFESGNYVSKSSSFYRIRQGYLDRINSGLQNISSCSNTSCLNPVVPVDPEIGSGKLVKLGSGRAKSL